MSKLEYNFTETARAVDKVAKARRNVAIATSDVGDHLNTFATTETYTPLANGIKKLARTTKVSADLAVNQVSTQPEGPDEPELSKHSNRRRVSW